MAGVILSAALHAIWNFLLRRAGGSNTVVALSKLAEAVVLLPLTIVVFATTNGGITWTEFLPVIGVAAVLALVNYAALTAAYRRAELSLVYPVARGGVFLFLPVLGSLVFQEHLSTRGWLALALIVVGILVLPLQRIDGKSLGELGRHMREPFIAFALLAAAATASYTIWDKFAVGRFNMIIYFYGYTALLALWFAGALARMSRAEVIARAREYPVSIILIGLLNAGAYLLILMALRGGMATQILAVRQLSIPIGVLLGWHFLKESLTAPRLLGSSMITTGCIMAALL